MEVPTKWSRASVISFIKGLGKSMLGGWVGGLLGGGGRVGHMHGVFASFGTNSVGGLELAFISHLCSEVGSHGQERSGRSDSR